LPREADGNRLCRRGKFSRATEEEEFDMPAVWALFFPMAEFLFKAGGHLEVIRVNLCSKGSPR
jgi:hypothetical protein